MKQTNGFYPRPKVDTAKVAAVGQAGGVLLTQTVITAELDVGLSAGLAPWRKPFAVHDPGKVVLDLALSLALGGDCLADVGVLRAEPWVYGLVASDPTVSRTVAALAADAPAALAAIDTARAAARAQVWALAGKDAPDHHIDAANPLVVDLDATLVTSHSDKEQARPTYKRDFGFHPLWAFADRGPDGTGEPLAVTLRAGNAGSNTAADHIDLTREAFGAATVPPPRDLPRAAGPGPGRWRRVHPAAPLGPGALGVPSPRGHRPAAGLGSTRLSTTPPAPTTRTTTGSGTGADPGTTPGAHCHTPMPQ